jgi:putative pyruvate formate lyase activating enzyme
MWRIIRPDAANAFEDPLVKKLLARYVKVAENKLSAKFQIAKKVPIKTKSWQEHENAMEKFRMLQKRVDKGLDLSKLKTPKKSLLDLKIFLAKELVKSCELCEHMCKVNRLAGEQGFCKVNDCLISSEFVHTGEESYYVPSHTVFFWSCNMQCVFCQNYTISNRLEEPIKISPTALAKVIERRRDEGCRNCNLVGGEPTPFLLWILEALNACKVNVPIVWNSNMYMSEKTMKILDGIVDVYLTDFKFGPGKCSERLTKVKNYWNVVTRKHLLACEQTEVTIRHLILPNHLECCSFPIIEWIGKNIRDKCLVNPMDQYYPCFLAKNYPEINRRLTYQEYEVVLEKAKNLGLNIRG